MSADQAMILIVWALALVWAVGAKSLSIYSIELSTTLLKRFAGLSTTLLWITRKN